MVPKNVLATWINHHTVWCTLANHHHRREGHLESKEGGGCIQGVPQQVYTLKIIFHILPKSDHWKWACAQNKSRNSFSLVFPQKLRVSTITIQPQGHYIRDCALHASVLFILYFVFYFRLLSFIDKCPPHHIIFRVDRAASHSKLVSTSHAPNTSWTIELWGVI